MSSTDPSSFHLPESLEDAERFQRLFVQPMVDAVRTEMKQHVDEVKKALQTVNSFEGRVSRLESGQKKALVGWSVYASAAATVLAYGYNWIKSHIHIG